MKTYHKLLYTLLLIIISATSLYAQINKEAEALIKQGIQLHDEGKYGEAVEKYQLALKADPASLKANYEIGYSYFVWGKGKESIPYLEKVIQSKSSLSAGAYDLLGSIYDDDNQPQKAIGLYKEGIKADPEYQRLFFNLAITYYRIANYTEAETFAIQAIKLEPTHASSHRIYAMAAYKQQKRICALMAFCNFLLLEPQTKRSEEAYKYVTNILHSNITKQDSKNITLNFNPNQKGDPDIVATELPITMAVAAATTGKSNLSPTDSLAAELQSVFNVTGAPLSDKVKNPFFWSYYASYFGGLAKSNNLPAFARYISLSARQEDGLKWFKDNPEKLDELDKWIKATPRKLK
jgi:tetratricopeptide (TPR) repeat protein